MSGQFSDNVIWYIKQSIMSLSNNLCVAMCRLDDVALYNVSHIAENNC